MRHSRTLNVLASSILQECYCSYAPFVFLCWRVQVCKRCTDLKRKKCQSNSSFQAVSSSQITQTVTLDSAVNSVIVRKMPTAFVGDPIRSCNHFQWTWCPGLPNNPKCQVRGVAVVCCSCVLQLCVQLHVWSVRLFLIRNATCCVMCVFVSQGSNRHEQCPKYLAKSTFWKHRLPLNRPEHAGGAEA
jgi:hypothetical protein